MNECSQSIPFYSMLVNEYFTRQGEKFLRGRQGYYLYCFSCLIILGGNEVNSVLEGYPFNNNYNSLYCPFSCFL